MELLKVKLLQRVAEQADLDFRAARWTYIQEHLDMDVKQARIAEDLDISRQYLNVLIKEASPQPATEPTEAAK